MGLGLKPVKIKMMPNDTYAFVIFRCEEDRKVSTPVYAFAVNVHTHINLNCDKCKCA